MAKTLDQKLIVEQLLHGTFSGRICLVCLGPLKINNYEDIFTLISMENKSYSIADILETLCQVTFQDSDHYNICLDCFKEASSAYKFYLTVKRSQQILHFYTEAIITNTNNLIIEKSDPTLSLCIQLPLYTPDIEAFDFNYEGVGNNQCENEIKEENLTNYKLKVCVKTGKKSYLNITDVQSQTITDSIKTLDDEKIKEETIEEKPIVEEKKRKKFPIVYYKCQHCCVKYRFVEKFKEHMRIVHDINIYNCRICKKIFDTRKKYDNHKVFSHPRQYQCSQCDIVYSKKYKLLMHMERHAGIKISVQTASLNACEVCGELLNSIESLEQHECKSLYKLQDNIKTEDELILVKNEYNNDDNTIKKIKVEPNNEDDKRIVCQNCGKSYRQQRSLRYHQRLHCKGQKTAKPTLQAEWSGAYKYAKQERLRKCCKCGASPAQDNVSLFRFPKPGKYNSLRCQLWAKFIFPERPKDWMSVDFHDQMSKEHKMLCQKHFDDMDFKDPLKRWIKPNAVPMHNKK